MANKIRITGLWKHKTREGKTYFSGKWGDFYVNIWPNDRKEPGSTQPDAYLDLQQPERNTQWQGQSQTQQRQQQGNQFSDPFTDE